MEKRRTKTPMKTHAFAERALAILIDDYNAGLPPTTYSELARRCGFEGQNVRVFGQVTDLIDGACALADVPSFALVRVRQAKGNVNDNAWRKGRYCHLRDRIIARAKAGKWTDEDFTKVRDALAIFSARAFGNKKAWAHVYSQIKMEDWAGVAE